MAFRWVRDRLRRPVQGQTPGPSRSVAALDGIPLLQPTGDSFGGSFTLTAPPRGDTIQPVCSNAEIELPSGRNLIVVRGTASPATYEDALDKALAIAQRGLDLLSVRGVDNLTITRGVKDHLVWWTRSGETILRIVNSSTPPI
jgi:hypothetical protein